MRTLLTLAAVAALAVLPNVNGSTEIGSGHIVAGTTIVSFLGSIEGVSGFFVPAPAAGTNITTSTTDNSGLGYDLDFYFADANGEFLGACSTEAADESCAVPVGAAEVEVAAFFGVDLDVVVLAG